MPEQRYVFRHVLSEDECHALRTLPPVSAHHTDDGHGDDKAHRVTWLADRLTGVVQDVLPGGSVDPMVKVYRLGTGDGVPQHCDKDYEGPRGFMARWSLLCYLSDGHQGGETRFTSGDTPHVGSGDVLLFSHSDRHEATPVQTGERFVLKTDVFTEVRG
jgi:hypothetical protein